MLPNPPSSTASMAGRPVITASVPTNPASARNPATAPGCARASRGSATIGESVPSKSIAISAVPGSCRIAASPARPSAVLGAGSPPGSAPVIAPSRPPDRISRRRCASGTRRSAGARCTVRRVPPPRAARVILPLLSTRGPALGARTHPVAAGALAAQPLDQNGVEPERFRPVDEVVQQLVVAGRGEPKEVGDRLLLGTRLPPPAPLERHD